MIRLPYGKFSKKRLNYISENIDIFPTILDLIGVEGLEDADGRTVVHAIESDEEDISGGLSFTELGPDIFSTRTADFRYIANPKNVSLETLKGGVYPKGKNYIIQTNELYDLTDQEYEQNNVFDEFREKG